MEILIVSLALLSGDATYHVSVTTTSAPWRASSGDVVRWIIFSVPASVLPVSYLHEREERRTSSSRPLDQPDYIPLDLPH